MNSLEPAPEQPNRPDRPTQPDRPAATQRRLGQSIDIVVDSVPRGQIRHAVFDFDGTLSLIREGWQDVMIPMMVEALRATGTGETDDQLECLVREFVTRLTGKQTIYQMMELVQQVQQRGGSPREPLEYKHEYLARLEHRITGRIAGLEQGTIQPDSLLIPGSLQLLERLQREGVRLYLASGTDEPYVVREARLLGVASYFDGGIYGAQDDYKRFSKKMIIDRILSENQLSGPELVGIGDGYVEIENTKGVGGIAVGVPSFESDPVRVDDWKRDRLLQAGADVLTPNFSEADLLVDWLLGRE